MNQILSIAKFAFCFVDDRATRCQGRSTSNNQQNPYESSKLSSDYDHYYNDLATYRAPSLEYGDIVMYFTYTSLYFLILVLFMYIFIQKDIKRLI